MSLSLSLYPVYWLIFLVIVVFAWIDVKKMIIVWMPLQLLFNDMVALKFSAPVLTLGIAVNFLLPAIFFVKMKGLNTKRKELNNSRFFYKEVYLYIIISYALSLIFSIAPIGGVINQTAKFFVKNLLMVYLFFRCMKSPKDIQLFLKTAIVVGILIGILGLIEAVLVDNPIQDLIYLTCPNPTDDIYQGRVYYVPPFVGQGLQMRMGLVRAYSFFNIHIAFGVASLLLGFTILYFLRYSKMVQSKVWIVFSFLAIVFCLSGVFTCNSKTSILGLALMLLCFYDFKSLMNWKLIIPLVGVAIIVLIYVPQYIDSFLSIFGDESEADGSTVSGRRIQLQVAMNLFFMNPLIGNGLGSISYAIRHMNAGDILGAESSVMQILPERGILGFCAYLFWYYTTYLQLRKVMAYRIPLFFLGSLFAMEFVTGILDIALYSSIVIVLYRYNFIKKRARHIFKIQKVLKMISITENGNLPDNCSDKDPSLSERTYLQDLKHT